MQIRTYITAAVILFCACQSRNSGLGDLAWVNLAHLNHLYQEIEIDGNRMAIIHIYSEYPDYEWVDAHGEGIACVDDAARAAVVYLRHFEITGEVTSLKRARNLLEFCRFMQADDGQFYNFIFADHAINRDGETSFKSLGWWAARGIWAFGEGYRVFQQQDAEYANLLEHHLRKTFAHIDTLLAHYPEVRQWRGFAMPQWLLYNSAADATSELMFGLAAYARASADSTARHYLRRFGDGLIEMQMRSREDSLKGLHLSWRNIWHAWANGQTQALVQAGKLLGHEPFISAAELEATHFYPYWLAQNFPREIVFAPDGEIAEIKQFDQIAYGLRPVVVGLLNLYDVTGDTTYARLAAEGASWFFGNNPAQIQMYDPYTGRCFDGILSASEINRNAGAESTIEALYALLEVAANPIAKQKLTQYIKQFRE